MTKAEAIIELILEERKKKSIFGTNRKINGNGTFSVLINQINEDEQDGVEAIRKNGYEGPSYNQNHPTNRSRPLNALTLKNMVTQWKDTVQNSQHSETKTVKPKIAGP
jgi:hypothetical protein